MKTCEIKICVAFLGIVHSSVPARMINVLSCVKSTAVSSQHLRERKAILSRSFNIRRAP